MDSKIHFPFMTHYLVVIIEDDGPYVEFIQLRKEALKMLNEQGQQELKGAIDIIKAEENPSWPLHYPYIWK